jgi:hypothetical protein
MRTTLMYENEESRQGDEETEARVINMWCEESVEFFKFAAGTTTYP